VVLSFSFVCAFQKQLTAIIDPGKKMLKLYVIFLAPILFSVALTQNNLQTADIPATVDNLLTGVTANVATAFKNLLVACALNERLFNVNSNQYLSCFSYIHNAPLFNFNILSGANLIAPNAERPAVTVWYRWHDLPLVINGRAFTDWDRGHLVPNNDFRTAKQKELSFITINRAPQLPAINRGLWRCIEAYLRQVVVDDYLANKAYRDIAVVTALKYDIVSSTVAEQGSGAQTSIPTHFYKFVYLRDVDGALLYGFCIEQQNTAYDNLALLRNQLTAVFPVIYKWSDCALVAKSMGLNMPQPSSISLPTFATRFKAKLYRNPQHLDTVRCNVLAPDCDTRRVGAYIMYKTFCILLIEVVMMFF
jgi:DNA/RNA endonuclease G (NUC1)